MLKIRNNTQVLVASVIVVFLAVAGILLHVQVNYAAEMRDTVRMKAVFATMAVSFPLVFLIMWEMKKNHILSTELQRLLNRDRLTDVATRDFFFERLAAAPDGYGVSLMVDIDHFKHVNDTHGHLAGDAVIRQVANILAASVRPNDIVCRFGGEEFMIFLEQASPEDGWDISERIRKGIEATGIQAQDGVIRVTVSVGGSLKQEIEDITSAIMRADACLYRAKDLGRNRTIVDWHDDVESAA